MRVRLAALALALTLGACATREPPRVVTAAPTPSQQAPPAEPVCGPVSGISDSDGDLARVSGSSISGLCAEIVRVSDIGRSWVIQRFRTNRPGPLWVIPHDNENSAFVAGIQALQRHGGTLVALDNYGMRNNDHIDPNRVFGGGGSCRPDGAGTVAPAYTAEMLRGRLDGQPIIALHTNGRGYAGDDDAGSGNTSIIIGGRYRTSFPAGRHHPGSAPGDALAFVAGAEPWPSGATAHLIEQLNMSGVNVVYEHVQPAWTDCSLSNYALLANLGFYINIETVEGDVATHARIIDVVMRLLTSPSTPAPVVS